MSSSEVAQLGELSELFAIALERFRPRSVAILGVAGGNGLDRIDPQITTRVVGFDLNSQYLDETLRRHGRRLNLDLHCVDLAVEELKVEPFNWSMRR